MRNSLRVRRAELEISQEATAARAGLHPNRYWRIEKCQTEPTEIECLAIAGALKTTAVEIFPDFDQAFPAKAATPAGEAQPCR
jgi:transcriptional regulator with XRE-family HTH domain